MMFLLAIINAAIAGYSLRNATNADLGGALFSSLLAIIIMMDQRK